MDPTEKQFFLVNNILLTPGVHKSLVPGHPSNHFGQWHIIFVGPQYVTCFILQFWHLEFQGGS